MKNFPLTYTDKHGFKWALTSTCSIFLVVFFLFFQPFGVNNYRPDEKIGGTFALGVLIFAVTLFLGISLLEFFIKPSTPTLTKYVKWAIVEYVVLTSLVFLVYNWLGEFHDFTFTSYIRHFLQFAAVMLFPFVGTHFYFRHREVQMKYHVILSEHVRQDVVELKGDYKKDAIVLPKKNIVCVKSEDNYASLHYISNGQIRKYLIRSTIKKLEGQLNFKDMVRCNRATLINVQYLSAATRKGNGMVVQLLYFPEEIVVSKSRMPDLQSKLKTS